MSPTDQAGRPLWRRRTQRKTKPGQNINNGSHKTKPDQDHEETHEFKHVFLSWSRLITFIMWWCLPLTHVFHSFNMVQYQTTVFGALLAHTKKVNIGLGPCWHQLVLTLSRSLDENSLYTFSSFSWLHLKHLET